MCQGIPRAALADGRCWVDLPAPCPLGETNQMDVHCPLELSSMNKAERLPQNNLCDAPYWLLPSPLFSTPFPAPWDTFAN